MNENLEYFCAVAEDLNMTKAAERLHTTQQTLSNHIARLERDYRITLFERKPRLRLTYAGTCFYEYVRKLRAQEEALLERFDEIRTQREGRLSIAVTQTRTHTFLPLILPTFMERNPTVSLDVQVLHITELDRTLLSGDADLFVRPAIARNENASEAVELVPVAMERIFLIIPLKFVRRHFADEEISAFHRLSDEELWRRILSTPLLSEIPYILAGKFFHSFVERFFRTLPMRPHVMLDLHSAELISALPFCSAGAVFITSGMLPQIRHLTEGPEASVFPLPFTQPDTFIPILIGYSKARGLSWPAQKFLSLARERFASPADSV